MIDKMQLIEEIQAVFGQNEYPGDDYLIGSSEGSEPRLRDSAVYWPNRVD